MGALRFVCAVVLLAVVTAALTRETADGKPLHLMSSMCGVSCNTNTQCAASGEMECVRCANSTSAAASQQQRVCQTYCGLTCRNDTECGGSCRGCDTALHQCIPINVEAQFTAGQVVGITIGAACGA